MNRSSPPIPQGIHKILVFRPNAVGDFVFSLPALHALKEAFPDAELVYAGHEWHAAFLGGRPGPVDRVVVVPPVPGIGLPPEAPFDRDAEHSFVLDMQRETFDLAVQLYGGGAHANPFLRRLGARLNIGLRASDAPPLDRWVAYTPWQNRRLLLLEVAVLVGANRFHLGRELNVTPQDRDEALRVLGEQSTKPLVLIQPGASDPRRRWPAERFATVADRLVEAGALVAVQGSADESGLVRQVLDGMRHPAIDLSGKLSLGGLCGVLEGTSLLVSNDTGPLHLATAIGTPTVGIYWLCNLIESQPLRQEGHRAAVSFRADCPVCGVENLRERCAHDESFVADVEIEEVIELAMSLFRPDGGRQGTAESSSASA